MKVALDLPGVHREIADRGGPGFFEQRIYYRPEIEWHNEAKCQVHLRVTGMVKTADGGLYLIEAVEYYGIDCDRETAARDALAADVTLLNQSCDKYGVKLIEGRIEPMMI